MPHVIVKLYPGRTEEQKTRLADAIVRSAVDIAQCAPKSVSVAIEEVAPGEWAEKVHTPDILGQAHLLYRKPGYNPLE
jgi:4-oxalocrotonate tautomerase